MFGRFFLGALLGATCCGVGGMATAADLLYKAPPRPIAAAPDWSGFYLGGSLGGRWSDATWTSDYVGANPPGRPDPTTSPASFDTAAVRFGVYAGVNLQLAPQWMGGIEADLAWGDSSRSQSGIPGTFGSAGLEAPPSAVFHDTSSVKQESDGSLRARLGFLAAPDWMLYVAGGAAWQQLSVTAACDGNSIAGSWCFAARNESVSETRVGWTVGGGLEKRLWERWLSRAEYRYADYGSLDHDFFANAPTDQVPMHLVLRTHTVLVGMEYSFGVAR